MIYTGILLKTIGFACFGTWRAAALAAYAASLLLDAMAWTATARARGRPVRAAALDLLVFNAAGLVFAGFLSETARILLLRFKEGVPALAWMVGGILNLSRLPVARVQGTLHLSTMAGILEMPVTYSDLGLEPGLLLLGFGATALLLLKAGRRDWFSGFLTLFAAVFTAGVLRLACSFGLFVAACYFLDYKSTELPVLPFRDTRLILLSGIPFLLLFAPVLGARRVFGASAPATAAASPAGTRRRGRGAWAGAAVMALLLAVFFWKPQGRPKDGAVLINTFHTHWSRTDRAYDKAWFGSASGYNYYCLKTLLNVFFDVRTLDARLSEDALSRAGVLVIYDPDTAFTPEELRAVRNFVRRGGGLFLIGDHTNVFGSTSHLNTLCRPFGFEYRDDVLFDERADFFQIVFPAKTSSFFLKGIDIFKFRGPCSIRPRSALTSTVIDIPRSKAMRAIYCVNNFYPRPADDPAMKTGSFAVAVASQYGRGRVFAFADSTIFSQFEIFYPGKYEMLTSVVKWLDRRDVIPWPPLRAAAALAAAGLFAFGLLRCRTPRAALAWCVACVAIASVAAHAGNLIRRGSWAPPEPRRPADFLFFVADRDDPRWALTRFYSESDYAERYDIWTQWVLRNGMFPAFYLSGRRHSHDLHDRLARSTQVRTGMAFVLQNRGMLRLLDGVEAATLAGCGRCLFMLGAGVDMESVARPLMARGCFGREDLAQARPVPGVERSLLVRRDGRRYVFVLDAERFSDKAMGYSEKVVPSATQKELYEHEYRILDAVFARD